MKKLIWMCALALPLAAESRISAPFPVDVTSEAAIAVVNACAVQTQYTVAVYDALTGETLLSKQGTVAGLRGKVEVLTPPVSRDALVAVVSTSCAKAPLASITIRDRVTKAPRFFDDMMEGSMI